MNDYDIEDLDETSEDTIVLDIDDDTTDLDDLETPEEDEADYDEYEDDEYDDDDEDAVTSTPVTTFTLAPLRDDTDAPAESEDDETPDADDIDEDADDETSADTEATPFRIDIDTDGLNSAAVEAISSVNDVVTVKSDTYSVHYTHISPHQVVGTKPIKDYRADTYSGLFNVIREMKVIVPIVVTPLAEYADFLADNNITTGAEADELGYAGPRYRLIDGWRRVFASLKNNQDEIPAAIITFHDIEVGRDLATLMHLVLNRAQKHTWPEKWSMQKVMEESYSLTPSMLDWLLNLDAGDSMRLKEVMLAEYPEVTEDFLSGKKDLMRSYKALEKLRKEEANPTAGDDDRKISSVDEASDLATDDTGDAPLSDEEVKNLLEMGDELREVRDLLNKEADTDDTDIDDDNYGGDPIPENAAEQVGFEGGDDDEDMFGEVDENTVQDTKDRKPLSKELRTAILARDEFTCQACGYGKGITSMVHLGQLEAHHKTSVYVGGSDAMSNFVTLCQRCHGLVHILAGFNAKIGMTKEEFEKVPDNDQTMFRVCIKFAKIILKAEEETGKALRKYKPVRNPFWEQQKQAQEDLEALEDEEATEDTVE
ncbi:MAG: HNH endonuclease [Rothia mucilaginosa]|uniref:HNH endonuclease n=1 Tax=Rothia mucilaginosa TaxID=43675 RepID=A0A930LCM9_9MICC|nr:HNH endonuclease [Rothia mucilaginosa]MBF1664232.1 HNH endonuclease [Rothia mucilaginosa]